MLDTAGEPIAGLYAAGGAAMGISGHGAAGYLAGNGLLSALGLAYLAADHVALTASRRTTSHDPVAARTCAAVTGGGRGIGTCVLLELGARARRNGDDVWESDGWPNR